MEVIVAAIGTLAEGIFKTVNLGQQRRLVQEQNRLRIDYFEDDGPDYTLIGLFALVAILIIAIILKK
jgi:hypothetical protein